MKNTVRSSILAAALVLGSTGAQAALKNIENAYETSPSQAVLPATRGGQVIIRECPGCKPVVMRVSEQTTYFVGLRNPVTLEDLRRAAEAAPDRLLTVFYSLDTGIVTRIVLGAR